MCCVFAQQFNAKRENTNALRLSCLVSFAQPVARELRIAVALVAQASRFEKNTTGSALGGQGAVSGVSLNAFDEEEKERDRIRSALVR